MKKVIENTKKGILILAMFATSLGFANEGTPFFRLVNNAKKTSLTLNNVKEGNKLYLKDSYGVKLYEETIIKNGYFSKAYDLTTLPNGNYYFELDTNIEVKVIPFTIESNAFDVNTELAKAIFKPTVKVKGDLVFISKLALNNEPLKIEVFYEKENSSVLVLTETIEGTINIERVYKLTDDLKSGDYKLVFTTNGREFTEFINN